MSKRNQDVVNNDKLKQLREMQEGGDVNKYMMDQAYMRRDNEKKKAVSDSIASSKKPVVATVVKGNKKKK